MMNWKGFERKQPWPNFKVLFCHMPEGIEKTHKKPVRIAGLWAEIWTRDLLNVTGVLTTRCFLQMNPYVDNKNENQTVFLGNKNGQSLLQNNCLYITRIQY
jgi:putative SOS response-associated peptidase YedK